MEHLSKNLLINYEMARLIVIKIRLLCLQYTLITVLKFDIKKKVYFISSWEDEKILEIDGVMEAKPCK